MMPPTNLTRLLESVASTIADYRLGEIPKPDAAHVERWLSQFDSSARFAMLEELDHLLKQTYVSRGRMAEFLGDLVTNAELTGKHPSAFWAGANILRLQDRTKSQHAMLRGLEAALQANLGVQFSDGDADAPFIYLDDGLFSGGTIRQDLRGWIQKLAPTNATVHVVVLAYHESGGYFSKKQLIETARTVGKTIAIHVWRLIDFEDRLSEIERSEVFRPKHVVGDALVEEYAAKLAGLGWPPRLRVGTNDPGGRLFRSAVGRDALEWELLRAGCRILNGCKTPSRFMRPLGVSALDTLGFGAVFVTHRNCPNNWPLALWWGDGGQGGALDWYPLLPRRPPESTAAFFKRIQSQQPVVSDLVSKKTALGAQADHDDEAAPWESEATEALEHALDELIFDFDDKVVVVPNERGQTILRNFSALLAHLMEAYDEAWYANAPFEGGEAVVDSDSQGQAGEALDNRFGEELDRLGWR